jgi:diaminohydroxyphosphoribosylaminopyrimidine deaminase/5-amino-6-(5-phosphoribosylamino)uracil reductase
LAEDARWLAAAASLATRARPSSAPNPGVAAIVVKDGVVLGRGWTAPGGRPHAEALALAQAGAQAGPAALGATLYVTLEPCAHASPRGADCAGLVAGSGIVRVVIGCGDPDPRTDGQGIARLRAAGITVDLLDHAACRASLGGFLTVGFEKAVNVRVYINRLLVSCTFNLVHIVPNHVFNRVV